MSSLKQELQHLLSQAAKEISGLTIKPESILVEHPGNPEFGDYSSNLGIILASRSKNIKPDQILRQIKEYLTKQSSSFIDKVEIKNNFINITIKNDYFLREMGKVVQEGEQYGFIKPLNLKPIKPSSKIMVEFADPNTHKAFHVGHLRNISIGESLIRILEAQGYQVMRACYQGDVGMHIAKCLWSLCKSRGFTSRSTGETSNVNPGDLHQRIQLISKAYSSGSQAYETDNQAKKEILEINKKIYNREDPKINQLWSKTRQWSLDYFESIYKRVDSHFDRYYFESEVFDSGKANTLKGLEKGIFEKSKGAVIFPGKKYGLHDRVFITGGSYPTYEGKDMGLGIIQYQESLSKLIIRVVGPEQAGYFKVVFEAQAQLFPILRDKFHHLIAGWVKLKKGKMSSRLGNVILGEWLLDEAKKRIIKAFPEVNQETAEAISVGAVKYSFLKVNPASEISFDFDESISLQGNSGPYLQYTYARAQSVLRKAQVSQKGSSFNAKPEEKVEPLRNFEEQAILRTIYKFPEIIEQAGQIYNPSLICNFLYDLAQKYNAFYNRHRILDSTMKQFSNETIFRLLLTAGVSQILANGLYLLGIKTPEKM